MATPVDFALGGCGSFREIWNQTIPRRISLLPASSSYTSLEIGSMELQGDLSERIGRVEVLCSKFWFACWNDMGYL